MNNGLDMLYRVTGYSLKSRLLMGLITESPTQMNLVSLYNCLIINYVKKIDKSEFSKMSNKVSEQGSNQKSALFCGKRNVEIIIK
jgi:hypothetical protein